jgi:hypothetical protein
MAWESCWKKALRMPPELRDILSFLHETLKPWYGTALTIIAVGVAVFLIDRLFSKSLLETLKTIVLELREVALFKWTIKSLNALGGIFIFLVVFGVGISDILDRILGSANPGPIPGSTCH